MRDIKFRAKSSVYNDWVYGNLIIMKNKYIDGECEHKVVIPFEDICIDGHHIHCDSDRPVFVEENTIGQYTGFKDDNGKEIYEGDILEWDEGLFDDCKTFKIPVKYEDGAFYPISKQLCGVGKVYAKVIGNIFDNP